MTTITLELTEEQARLLQAYAAYMNTPPEPGLPRYPFTAAQWAATIIVHRIEEWAGNHPEQASTHTEAVT
jgi:hypothetical protein